MKTHFYIVPGLFISLVDRAIHFVPPFYRVLLSLAGTWASSHSNFHVKANDTAAALLLDIESSDELMSRTIAALIDMDKQAGRSISRSCYAEGEQDQNIVWKLPYNMEVTHISKTAGTSFRYELINLQRSIGNAPRNSSIHRYNNEKCFLSFKIPDAKHLVLVRSPASHVFSQFAECRDDRWGKEETLGTGFPRSANLTQDYLLWLRHFAALSPEEVGSAHDYNCYDPRNFISRFMSCTNESFRRPVYYPHHAHLPPPEPLEALRSLLAAEFVGIADLYLESICLLEVMVRGRLSKRCGCYPGGIAPIPPNPHSPYKRPTSSSIGSHHAHNSLAVSSSNSGRSISNIHSRGNGVSDADCGNVSFSSCRFRRRASISVVGRAAAAKEGGGEGGGRGGGPDLSHEQRRFSYDDHRVSHLPYSTLVHPQLLPLVRGLTDSGDALLFRSGLLRLLCDVRRAERLLRRSFPDELQQHHIICPGQLRHVLDKVSYLFEVP